MQITLKQLPSHLAPKKLAPLYVVHGDEPFLLQQACDLIHTTAKEADFIQKKVFHLDTQTHWEDALLEIQHEHFFGEKQFIELRNPKAKLDTLAKNFLENYLKNPSPNKQLLMITEKLTAAQQKTKWFQLLNQHGVIVTIWPLRKAEYPPWLGEQFKKAALTADPQGIQYLAQYTEGNLLAAQQIIELLALLYPKAQLSFQQIKDLTIKQAQFTVFELGQAAITGQIKRALFILKTLKENKSEPVLILWALTKHIRDAALAKQAATSAHELSLLLKAEFIDQTIKGLNSGDFWLLFEELIFGMAKLKVSVNHVR